MKLIFIFLSLLSSFLIKGQNVNQCEDIDGAYFVWESENLLDILNWSKYSIIYFDNDTVRMIDFPFDPAGMLNYRVGTYVLSNSTGEITCSIKNIYTISLNTGQIVWGVRRCKHKTTFELEKDHKISWETTRFFKKLSEENGFERVKETEIRSYTRIDKGKLKHKTEYLKRFEKYRRHPKITRCRKYERSKKTKQYLLIVICKGFWS